MALAWSGGAGDDKELLDSRYRFCLARVGVGEGVVNLF